MGLPSFSIKRPVLTGILYAAIVILGLISLSRLKVELYQGQSMSIISIVVRARGGLPSEDVEKMITKPIEEAIGTVGHMKGLYSSSREAESRVTMEFEPGTNMNFASLEIREKFARVKPLLPKEIEKPVIANYDDAQSAIVSFAVTSETLSPEQIREVVDVKLKPVVSRVDGVASVEVYGGRERKILVELDRDKMVAYNISIERVMDVLGQSNINLLAGNVGTGKYEFAIRSMGAFLSVEDIGEIGVKATRQGSIIPLKEIATIKDSYMEATDQARLNLEQNVTVYIKKASLANTLDVAKNLDKVLDAFEEDQHGNLKIVYVSNKAETIERAINDVKEALYIGLFLTMGVIYVFIRNWVLSAIILVVIPCSLITTFIFMAAFGISLNVMTLSGLALSIGILVDTAVVIMENIFSKKEKGHADLYAIREGSEEVWLPLLTSLLTMLVVFLPLVLINKTIQLTYWGFAFTICVSLIASFFAALMLIPMMIRQFGIAALNRHRPDTANTFIEKSRERYVKAIRWCIAKRKLVVLTVILLCGIAVWRLIKTPFDLPSTFEENEFAVVTFPLAGARLETNDEVMKKLEGILSQIPDVTLFSTTVSRDDLRLFIRLKPARKRTYSKDEIMKLIDEKGNAAIKEVHPDYSLIVDEGAGSSESKKLIVNIYGQDGDELERLAKAFAQKMSKVPGLTNLVMTDLRKRPEYALVVDKGKAAMYGLSVRKVADTMHAQIRGMRPTKFHELTKGQEIETITRLQAIYRQKLEDLGQIYVETKDNTTIPISEIANFYPSTGPQTIDRRDKHRYVFVKGDMKKPMEQIAQDVKKALKDVKLPDDYYWRFAGSYDDMMASKSQSTLALLLTFCLVYMVMACLFENYLYPLLIMSKILLNFIGVWIALAGGPIGALQQMAHGASSFPLFGGLFVPLDLMLQKTLEFFQQIPFFGGLFIQRPLSTQALIGMIMLAGYSVNAAILLVDHALHLSKEESKEERFIQAGVDRLRPIMMTALAAILGFLPMALNLGSASDLWSPLAVTIIGGLISSTTLILFVLPALVMLTDDIQKFIKTFFAAIIERLPFHQVRRVASSS
ncbi:MAG TPA: efflux RND transporter permease subunit [Candidatus Omnitrophota bacterium]|nr:efflux RND transporter permease subunit [Candidatus Omnitrophota bacterium]